jgi:hypothetical protein
MTDMSDGAMERRHGAVQLGDSVFVRTHVIEPARSPKLSFPVAGPYPIVGVSGSNVEIRTREGTQRVHLDRVVRCPSDLPSGVAWVPHRIDPPKTKRVPRACEEEDTYVIDRLISHARDEKDSCWLLRVRWAAYGPDDDTWKPAHELPEELVRKYERRKSLSPELLTSAEPPVIEWRPIIYEHGIKKRNYGAYNPMKPARAHKRTLNADSAGSRCVRSKKLGTRRWHVVIFMAKRDRELIWPFRISEDILWPPGLRKLFVSSKSICVPSLRARRKMKERRLSAIISRTTAGRQRPCARGAMSSHGAR